MGLLLLNFVTDRIKLEDGQYFYASRYRIVKDLEKRRRGRPPQYDPDEALDKAAEAFWKNGYAGTSLDDLAAATGMNRPSLYGAFGDKRAIYLATLERYRDGSRAKAKALLTDAPSLRVYLERFYDVALDIYLAGADGARGCYSIGTAATQAAVDPLVREFLADSIRSTDAFLADLVRKARQRGEVSRRSDPMALAQLATATLHTLAVRARAGLTRQELNAIAAAAIDVICGEHSLNKGGGGRPR
jgi:TetR/AcrR family transcriptional regulator, copper-responsive repressor